MLANKKPNILIVDDESPVRELMRRFLEPEGYSVMTAEGGRQALDLITYPEIQVDILITDILMPHMHGRELANRISIIRPFIKVLFISAYTAEILTHHDLCPDGSDLIKKPFNKATLMQRISQVWVSSPSWKELISRNS